MVKRRRHETPGPYQAFMLVLCVYAIAELVLRSFFPLREETIPIHDIRVSFRGYALGDIRLQPEGLKLEAKREGDVVTVIVPKLEVHSMVVAELAAQK